MYQWFGYLSPLIVKHLIHAHVWCPRSVMSEYKIIASNGSRRSQQSLHLIFLQAGHFTMAPTWTCTGIIIVDWNPSSMSGDSPTVLGDGDNTKLTHKKQVTCK